MIYASIDSKGIIRSLSKRPYLSKDQKIIKLNLNFDRNIIGKKINKSNQDGLKVAVLCNWGDRCGISTYTKYLVDALAPKVKEIKIFAEDIEGISKDARVTTCWNRGKSMRLAIKLIKNWGADIVLIQHEFGIFPKATHFLQMLQELQDIPYVITLHSVYEHLDKVIHTANIKNIIVHTKEAQDMLISLGNKNKINVIPHGCIKMLDKPELWNTFQTPYTIFQFGFGFFYKGVEVALEAISHLKNSDEKFKDIFYCYLCSESSHCNNIHSDYYNHICHKINKLKLEENVSILRGYHSESELEYFLRTSKIAIFPYTTDPNNIVYGSSGAIKFAMAHNIPVVASKNHLFDDLEGIIPRPNNYLELAKEIDEIFSNEKYKSKIINNSREFIINNSWDKVADTYLEVFKSIMDEGKVYPEDRNWFNRLFG